MAVAVVGASFARGQEETASEREAQAVLRVVKRGRAAVLADKPKQVCRLLTRHARHHSLVLFDYHYEGKRARRRPKTCVQAVGDQIDFAQEDNELRWLKTRPELRGLRVVRLKGKKAHVLLGRHTDIYLLKSPRGWRGDFANFSPYDGGSGR